MSLLTLKTVQELQRALHAKAKGEPKYRFYALYDKISLFDWAARVKEPMRWLKPSDFCRMDSSPLTNDPSKIVHDVLI